MSNLRQSRRDELRKEAFGKAKSGIIAMLPFLLIVIISIFSQAWSHSSDLLKDVEWLRWWIKFLCVFPGLGSLFLGLNDLYLAGESAWMGRQLRRGYDPDSVSQRLILRAVNDAWHLVIGLILFFGCFCLLGGSGGRDEIVVEVTLAIFPAMFAYSSGKSLIASLMELGRWKEIERRGEQASFSPPEDI